MDELCDGEEPSTLRPQGDSPGGQSTAGQGGVRETSPSPRRGRGCVNGARKKARRVPWVCLELLCLEKTIWAAGVAQLEGLRAYFQSRCNRIYCLSLKSRSSMCPVHC